MLHQARHTIYRRNLLLLFILLCSGLLLPSSLHLNLCVSFAEGHLAVTVEDCREDSHPAGNKTAEVTEECSDGHHLPVGCGRTRLDIYRSESKNKLRDLIALPQFAGTPVFQQSFGERNLYSEHYYSYYYSLPPPDKLLELNSIVIRC